MATTFPTSLQDLDATRGSDNDKLSSPNHVTHHANEDATIEALQTKVGIDSSADTTSLDYKLKNAGSSNPGHTHTLAQGATNVTATAAELNFSSGVTSAVQTQLDAKQARSTLTTKGDLYVATASATVARQAVGADGTVLIADSAQTNGIKWGTVTQRFGGTGADGALTLTSGATNIDCANAAVVVKNYTTISITGTGSLTFTNPHANGTIIILKSQGAVTLTSSTAPHIAAQSMGAAGGAGSGPAIPTVAGAAGSNPNSTVISPTDMNGGAGGGATGANSGAGGTAGTSKPRLITTAIVYKSIALIVGAGGGGAGGGTTGTGGTGGRGGGGLIIECGAALNFTTSAGISVAGANGTNGTANGGGGGGGGGGGFAVILYNSLTASSGTITKTGGTAGTAGGGGTQPNGGGGGGAASQITDGVIGNAAVGGGAGGDGGAGWSLVAANVDYV